MENKRKVLIFNGEQWDKQDFEDKISRLKDDISKNISYTEKEKQTLKFAIDAIEDEKNI